MADAERKLSNGKSRIDFQTNPANYRHWKLKVAGEVATLLMDVDEKSPLFEGYELKLNSYDLGDALAHIRVPMLIVQGEDDQYGTVRQIEFAQQECYCPVEVVLLAHTRHAPHREAPEGTLRAVAEFCNRLLRDHHESAMTASAAKEQMRL